MGYRTLDEALAGNLLRGCESVDPALVVPIAFGRRVVIVAKYLNLSADQSNIRVPVCVASLARQSIDSRDVVAIHSGNPLAGSTLDTQIQSVDQSGPGVCQNPHPRIVDAQSVDGGIGAVVVDNQELEISVALPEDTFDRLLEPRPGVTDRHQNGNFRSFMHNFWRTVSVGPTLPVASAFNSVWFTIALNRIYSKCKKRRES